MRNRIVIRAADDSSLDDNSVFEYYYENTRKFLERKKTDYYRFNKPSETLDLSDYAKKLQSIWNGIKQDDPYAEETLIEVERRLNNTFSLMNKLNESLDKILAQKKPGITIKVKQPSALGKISLDDSLFFTFHSIMGVHIIGSHESIVSKLITARKHNLISNSVYKKTIRESEEAVSDVLDGVKAYKKMGVTREDIFKKTPKGQEAIQLLGEPSLDILKKSRRSEHGPKLVLKKHTH